MQKVRIMCKSAQILLSFLTEFPLFVKLKMQLCTEAVLALVFGNEPALQQICILLQRIDPRH